MCSPFFKQTKAMTVQHQKKWYLASCFGPEINNTGLKSLHRGELHSSLKSDKGVRPLKMLLLLPEEKE
jgi:hypothetical protein